MPFTAPENLYVNADESAIVPADSPEAAFLLVGKGQTLSAEEARKYGLPLDGEAPAEGDADEAAEAKSAEEPENKAAAKGEDKASGVTINKAKKSAG